MGQSANEVSSGVIDRAGEASGHEAGGQASGGQGASGDGTAELRRVGLKVTTPRLRILGILEEADPHHLSAEDVYKALLASDSDIGLATVYRVLTQFEGAGMVTRHHFAGGQAVFELDNGDNHDHIVCVKSGVVAEFKDERIEDRLEEIAAELGYRLTDHRIVLYGVHEDAEG